MKRGLSLNQLAEQAGVSRQMLSYVEQEKRNPSFVTSSFSGSGHRDGNDSGLRKFVEGHNL